MYLDMSTTHGHHDKGLNVLTRILFWFAGREISHLTHWTRIPLENKYRSFYLERHLKHLGAHYAFCIRYVNTVCLSHPIPVCPSVATTYHLVLRSFRRYSLKVAYKTLSCHIRLISLCPPPTHPGHPRTLLHVSTFGVLFHVMCHTSKDKCSLNVPHPATTGTSVS